MLRMLSKSKIKYVTIRRDLAIEGRSWEMAASKAIQGIRGMFTGTVEAFTGDTVKYGEVPGLDYKEREGLVTSTADSIDLLSR